MKNATLMWPVRIAAAGKLVTPGGAVEICHILGKDETLRRLRLGLDKLRGMRRFLAAQFAPVLRAWRNGYEAEVRRAAIAFFLLVFFLAFGVCLAVPELRLAFPPISSTCSRAWT